MSDELKPDYSPVNPPPSPTGNPFPPPPPPQPATKRPKRSKHAEADLAHKIATKDVRESDL